MMLSKKETEAKSKIDALAKALGYDKPKIFFIQDCGKYKLAFKSNSMNPFDSYDVVMYTEEDEYYIIEMKDLLFDNDQWSTVVAIMERMTKDGYCLEINNGLVFMRIMKKHETIEEAIIRLNLDATDERS